MTVVFIFAPRERLLAVVRFGPSVAAFASIPFVDQQNGLLILWLVLLRIFGLTTALMTYGSFQH